MALSFPTVLRFGSPHSNDETFNTVLLNERIWSAAFAKKRTDRSTGWMRFTAYAQSAYEKSRVHYPLPVLVLIAYSIIGGYISYRIESPPEIELILQKSRFIRLEKEGLRADVDDIRKRVTTLQQQFQKNSVALHRHLRGYRKFALNQLHKKVYWYALSAYYLTEQETHKQQALRPRNTEPLWRPIMYTNFGRIHALRNYAEQLALRCWEIGVENKDYNWTTTQIELAAERFFFFYPR